MDAMKKGFGVVEILVGFAVLTAVLVSILFAFGRVERASDRAFHREQAVYLLHEGLEASLDLRDRGWANVSAPASGTTFGLVWNGTDWGTSTAPAVVDGTFTRTIRFDSVSRDSSSWNIVASGGVLDPDTRKATVVVSWSDEAGPARSQASLYLTNI